MACAMASTATKDVLFVDDEPGIRVTLSVILQKRGFRVQTAATNQIQSSRFDVLVCDLSISKPDDGYEVVDAMRLANPQAVILILTGYPSVENALEGIERKVDGYLVKPADVEKLIAVLNREPSRPPRARILSVSYDEVLLRTRHMLLQREGYDVVSAAGFAASFAKCKEGGFDLFVLGHSIPPEEKCTMVEEFRRTGPAL
jgi:DNA-binding response OmpR family regulator